MDKTLKDYIDRVTKDLEKDKKETPPVNEHNDYEVYPEDDGTDRPRNPYSRA